MFRRTLVALGGLLALFHGWLLGSQLWSGQLAEPGLVLRWAVAAGLVAALVALRRSGGSMFWGRKAICIWLLAALLHAPAMARRAGRARIAGAARSRHRASSQIAAASVIVRAGTGPVRGPCAAGFSPARPPRYRPALARARGAAHLERALRVAPRPPPGPLPFTQW